MASTSSSEKACCTSPPLYNEYIPRGVWDYKTLGGLKTYSITPGSKTAAVYLYDVGGYWPTNFQGADMLSETGVDVYIPDLLGEDKIDLPKVTAMSPEESAPIRARWRAGPGNVQSQAKVVKTIIEELRSSGYQKVVGVGFCWGGTLVSLNPTFDAHAIVHPGFEVDGALAEQLVNPTCLLPSKDEDEFKMEAFHRVMLSKPIGSKCILKWYRDMPHGWCAARADLKSPQGKAGRDTCHGKILV